MTLAPEGAETMYQQPPPDQQGEDLAGLLDKAFKLITADHVFTPDEQRVVGAFFAGIQQFIRARQAAGAGVPGAPPGYAPPQGPDNATQDYGTAPGAQERTGYMR